MKSKNPKIQILKKGIATCLSAMFMVTPLSYAATILDRDYLEATMLEKILYGTIGSTAQEIEEYLEVNPHGTLYILNETQLRALAEYVNNGNDCEGKQIILLNDIEVDSTIEWIPIGNKDNPFKGKFDGREHKISGINFNRNDKLYSEITNIGLFGYVDGATIQNITIANSKFDVPSDKSSDILYDSKDFQEVYDYVYEGTYESLGAIVGFNNKGTVKNCTVDSDVYITGMRFVGGVVGNNNGGSIENCTNKATVTAFSNVGGIVGLNSGKVHVNSNSDKFTIVNQCENYGKIYAEGGNAGGIVGTSYFQTIIQKCQNEGSVRISTENLKLNVDGQIKEFIVQNVGGIVGYISGGGKKRN